MDIHVVQQGDTINSIADRYGVSATRLIQDNGLDNPESLVTGQTIVVLYPEQTYIVKEGDSLTGIANAFGITVMQLLRNNPYLSDRAYLNPGETLVISYNTSGQIVTNGYAFSFINSGILKKTLPFLTYLSVYNYRTVKGGDIITYYDDSEVIRTSKEYGVAPLMLLTSLSAQGEANVEAAYELLLNETVQDLHINIILNMLKEKGYYGVNLTIQYLNTTNQRLYERYLTKVSNRLTQEGYYVLFTINPNLNMINNEVQFEKVDYMPFGQAANSVAFMQYNWGFNYGPPLPVSSVSNLKIFLDYALKMIPPEKTIAGIPLTGYDWELPYVAGRSRAISLTLDSIINLARVVDAFIQFDEVSQTPFFRYDINKEKPIRHIVWFVDSRSVSSIINIVSEYGLLGTGIWNIMNFISQLWCVINSQYEITKILL